MEDMVSVLLTISCVLVLTWIVKLGNWIWWKPMKLGRELREQGFRGAPYRLLYGCMKENSRMIEEAWSKPMNLDHQILPRIDPYVDKIVKGYGTGLANYQGEKWVKHKRLLSPAFHLEKLKVISFPSPRMLPAFSTCCSELVNRWELLIGSKESYELDVWPELQKLTADVISRTAFGSSYIEGKQIFQLQSERALLVSKALRTVYIPGFRYLPTKENIRMKKIQNEVQDLLWGIIKKRERAMKMGEPCNDDLLGLLLESNNEIRKEYKDNRLTIEEIIEEC
ncbi:cytochrome P450 CYP72A219-like protein [Cinnamomum micranthum f. kanehirae]|uniref:Cytochrome P450 CYP72A219-like protein n=1 Tax=Cinnamomum micranthum f. kanehirae TaxID=337451 RepID=A0A3S3NJ40_9MAGN|nr:cytochrome P450 CYP72A219-like protein [Cinnamomum micranthum f. kanehirae]